MAFKASPFVGALLLGATFITNEAISLGMEKIKKMETETESMSLSLMNAEASAKAMESVFYRSDEVHSQSMKKMMSEMSNDQALKVLHKLNHTDPAFIQLAEKAMHQGQAGLRGQLNKRHTQFDDPTTGGAVTKKQSDKTNSGVSSIRDMMNEMIEESMAKYDVEIDRCTSFYSSQCFTMAAARGKIAGANARAANARALIADAQSCINKCEEDIPELKQELKDFKKKCQTDKTQLMKRQTLLEGDLSTMGTILKLVDESCTTFLQTGSKTAMLQDGDQNGQVEMCVDECSGEHYLKVMHQEHRLKSSIGVKLLGEAVSDVIGGYGAPSFLQLNMRVGDADTSAVDSDADADSDADEDPGSWVAAYSKGAFGDVTTDDWGFNKLCRSSYLGIVKRECSNCQPAHKVMYFKRKTNPDSWNYFEGLLVTWRGDVGFHTDFDIFSSYADAVSGSNPWQFCNGNDNGIGFPRDCGPKGAIGWGWTSLTRGGQKNYKFSVRAKGSGGSGMKNAKALTTPAPKTKVPANPCGFDKSTGMAKMPQPANKRGAKCVMRGDCGPMKERFLQVRTSMEEEVDVIKQAIEDLTEHCEATETRLTRSIKTQEQLEDKCQSNLAQAQEKQNDAAKEADDTAAEHHDLHEELDKNMKTCHDNYMGYEGEICALKKIRGEVFKLKASGQTPFFQDCQLSPWTAGQCSKPCGGGTLTLTRKITASPMDGAKCLPLTAVRDCNAFPCPIDCKKDVWEPWSACSADCGGGIQQRVRELLVAPKFGGNACGAMEQTRRCNEKACDQPCKLAEWTEWSDCSKACDGGTSKRSRFMVEQATGTGTCADAWSPERLQYKACNSDPCQLSANKETMQCNAKLDIVLLIDGSGSLGQAGWDAEILAASTFISAFETTNTEVQMSAILYSGPSTWGGVANCLRTPKTAATLKSVCKIDVKHFTSNIGEVNTWVKALTWPGGSTLTSIALGTANSELDLGRGDAQSVVVCITDGRPLFIWNTWRASRALRKKARLMWVPVTKFAPLRFIKMLATRRWQENLIPVTSFDDLSTNKADITNHLLADLCPKEGLLS